MFCRRTYILAATIVLLIAPVALADDERLAAATESVTAAELYEHVATLADDVFEGRAVGSRGGRAAAQYILKQLRTSHLTPAGTEDGYFQPCDRGGRNILAILPGTDPKLAARVHRRRRPLRPRRRRPQGPRQRPDRPDPQRRRRQRQRRRRAARNDRSPLRLRRRHPPLDPVRLLGRRRDGHARLEALVRIADGSARPRSSSTSTST